MIVAGLDFATYKFGFCIGDSETKKFIRWGKVEIKANQSPGISQKERARSAYLRALELLREEKPDIVIMDDVRLGFGGRNMGHQDYYGKKNIGIIEEYCDSRNPAIRCEFVTSVSMRSKVFGTKQVKLINEEHKSRKAKPDWKSIIVKHYRALGYRIEDDDAADACGFVECGFKLIG